MADLSIIIVSFNTAGELADCLGSLRAHPPSLAHEVVVIDNASTDGTADMIRANWPSVRLLAQPRNVGFAAANNAGIRAVDSEFVLLLNSDTRVRPGALDTLVAGLRGRPDVSAIGPRIVDPQGRTELSFGPMMGPFNELRQKCLVTLHARGVAPVSRIVERRTRRPQMPDWISGACLLVRRADAVAAGLLDERYFLYAEDVDFCAALRARGGRIAFTPAAEIVHLRGASRRTRPVASEQAYRRSHLAFYEKHHPGWAGLLRLYLRLRGKLPPASGS
jgi:N-acetylglucosaminyl-diphospho-decaprenol L-rhamnosyltransferase